MARLALTNGTLLMPDGTFEKGSLILEDSKIAGISRGEIPADIPAVDMAGNTVSPGFIDTHTHGARGRNFMEGTADAYSAISSYLTQGGVTSCLATTTSASLQDTLRALRFASSTAEHPAEGQLNILGAHLEGPFVSPTFRGAHLEEFVREAGQEELEALWEAAGSALKVVTLAPEIPGGMEAVRFFTERGAKVSLGHSGASYEEAQRALEIGVCRATHLFCAMTPFHHRNPGVLPALLGNPGVDLELIVDGHHLHPAVVETVIRQAGVDRCVMITDSSDVTGLEPGLYRRWKGMEVVLKDGECRTLSGKLAGSVVRMDQGVRNLVDLVHLPLAEALRMASENPARSIDVYDRKGSLTPGKDADLVVLNRDLTVLMTIVNGQIVYDARLVAKEM